MNRYLKRFMTWDWLLLALIVAVSFGLRWYRIDGDLIGYHVVNEGFYSDLGTLHAEKGLFSAFTDPQDLNNPPLYAFLVCLATYLADSSIVAARAVSVIASTATIVGVYLLARDLYGRTAGLVAASVFGLAPGSVLVGGNAQIEGLMVLLRVSGLLAYERAARRDRPWMAAWSGALIGLATLAKLPSLIIYPGLIAWETWGNKGFGWLKEKRFRLSFFAFLAVATPWFIIQTIVSPAWVQGQSRLFSTFELPTAETVYMWLGSELFWLVSPLVFVTFIFSLFFLTKRRSDADVLVLVLLAANFAFYLFYSYHTYYLLPAVPLLAIAVGAFVSHLGIKGPRKTAPVIIVLVLILSISSAITMGGKKWGGWYAGDVRDLVVRSGYAPEHIALAVDEDILDSWGPAIAAAFPDTQVVHYPLGEDVEVPPDRPILHLRLYEEQRPADDVQAVVARHHGPVAFGHTVVLPATMAVHYFGIVDAKIVRVGPWYRFGVADTEAPTRLRVEVLRP